MLPIPFISGCQISSFLQIAHKMYSDCLHPVQGPLKIRNQLAIEPEIFSEVMTNLEKTTYFWAEFRSLSFK